MLKLSARIVGDSLHIDARPAAILDMACLNLRLAELIVERKFAQSGGSAIDPEKERAALETLLVRKRIENTAAILADNVWSKTIERLRSRWPLIQTASSNAILHRPIVGPTKRAPRVRRNHYSPVFCNRLWAGPDGMVTVYRRGVAGDIVSATASYRRWGFHEFLYSNALEAYLGLVDDDGACSQQKLVGTLPLTDLDKRRWIAFLVIQFFRTPSLLREMTERLRRVLPTVSPEYCTETRSLKAAYETLFTNNNLYARFHQLMAPRRWTILRAPPGASFIRADNPVMIRGCVAERNWCLSYPMTPSLLFEVGPDMGDGYGADFVRSRTIGDAECAALNQQLAAYAEHSVIAPTQSDGAALKKLLAQHMGTRGRANASGGRRLWGPLNATIF